MKVYYIDLFAGAGGTTTGAHLAGAEVIACVNHDANAIASHAANHPFTIHFTEDIRNFEVVQKLKVLVDALRAKEPGCVIALWASLECTNYSRAKGGLPRDADSRTLANHLLMYLEQLRPEYLFIENVREFMAWGELNSEGKPVDRMKGIDYLKWVATIQSHGYAYDWRILNSANFGSYQSRERFFGQFAMQNMPISWPEPTHAKTRRDQDLFGAGLKKWKAVKEVLDLKDTGTSIFNRKKPLVEATLQRIYAGLTKFVGKEFLYKNFSGNPEQKVQSIERPAGTITAIDHHSLVMLTSYYGNGSSSSCNEPCHTVTTKDRFAAIFIDNQYGNGFQSDVNGAVGTITINPKQALVTAQFLFNPQFSCPGSDIDKPSFTLIARMDKRPPYLISTISGESEAVQETGTLLKIREFMIKHNIADIRMRMLSMKELLRIQGFPENYTLKGTQKEQKKFIGNAVEVNTAKALVQANIQAVNNLLIKKAI